MKKDVVKVSYAFIGFLFVLSIIFSIVKVKSYWHTSARIGTYDVVSKELVINKANGEVKKVDLNTTEVYTTSENNL